MNTQLQKVRQEALMLCAPVFHKMEEISLFNMQKVLEAFRKNYLSAYHFAPSNGYGYGDPGREKLEDVWCDIFHAEASLVRPQFVSGTHALATVLLALLNPGDTMVSAVGSPYDTMQSVIGISGNAPHNLKQRGIHYKEVPLTDGHYDLNAIKNTVTADTKVVLIQRSRGYMDRESLFPEDIAAIIRAVKEINSNIICFVDNCYGEFVEEKEPSEVGADMIVGSLIKNPGGGLAPIGGYVAGRKDLIEQCAYRLTSPGLGKEVGASLGVMQSFYQGLFLAPTVVAGALKGAIFAANVYEKLGYAVVPDGKEERHDIIQAVTLGSAEGVIAFCQGIQAAAPVDSYVTPEPWAMPGYDSDVIMAAGAFVQGSSIELSADGPIKEPYAVYFQGGLTWAHAKLGILMSLQKLYEKGIVKEL